MKTRLLPLILCIFLLSCETEVVPPPPPPPDPVPTIGLTIEDTGVTEVWLRLSMSQTAWERGFTLVRDGVPIDTAVLLTADSVFVDEGLLPNQQYTYQAFRISGSEILDSTAIVSGTTMDTTSQEFTWEVFEFGDHSSSLLLDVAIIDENNIWAVGEIYLNDSTGQGDPEAYNLARWDGLDWNLSKVRFPACNGSCKEIGTGSYQGRSILDFSPSDIWIASLGSLVHWDGSAFARICMPIGYDMRSITTLWGTDGELYWGGTNGYLAYNGGSGWQQIATGTTLNIYDVYGGSNPSTANEEVYAVAAEQYVSLDRLILRIEGTTVTAVSDSSIPGSLRGIWFKPGRRYYAVGGGMYTKREITDDGPWQWLHTGVTQYYSYAIAGNDLNDIVVSGGFGEVLHFNGMTWRSYRLEAGNLSGNFYGIDIRGDLCVAVGQTPSRAIIAVGRRP